MERVGTSRVRSYVAVGVLLSLGAPLGWWLMTRALAPLGAAALYAYLFAGTCSAFVAFAWALGRMADRLARAGRQFEDLALTDPLTGLRNRRYFAERLAAECARADRDRKPLSLISVDLDLFKRINDEHGHPFGDRVLVGAARALSDSVRAGDVTCRTGGEEFVAICPGATATEAHGIAERFRSVLATSLLQAPSGKAVHVTASVGIGVHVPGGSPVVLFEQADEALYAAKRNGRDRIELTPNWRPDCTAGAA